MLDRLLLSFLTISPARAVVCPPVKTQIADDMSLIKKTGIIDDISFREAEGFASENKTTADQIKNRYAASNTFACETAWGQGQIVVRRDTIVVPAHTLYIDNDCDRPRPLDKCTLIFQDRGKDSLFAVDKVLSAGPCNQNEHLKPGDDWAVIRIKGAVPKSVTPYGIPSPGDELKIGDRVVDVGRSRAFNPKNIKGNISTHPKGYAECVALHQDKTRFGGVMQTNCPSSVGCSGCAVLSPGDTPKFMGLLTGEMVPNESCLEGDVGGEDGPFKRNCRGTSAVAAEGNLLRVLMQLKPLK